LYLIPLCICGNECGWKLEIGGYASALKFGWNSSPCCCILLGGGKYGEPRRQWRRL
jgi:hypothetical protein